MLKRLSTYVCALTLFTAIPVSCMAQQSAWNGSWKIDPATMKYDGATFTVATDSEGYTITREGTAMPKTVCDGQAKPGSSGASSTCTKSGSGYQVETVKDGKTISKMTVSLSEDGKTLTRKAEFFPPDDSPYTMTAISTRVSGGPGYDGVWKQTDMQESMDSGIITIAVHGDSIEFKETDAPKPMSCKLDGTETSFPGGGSMAVKQVDARTLKVIYRGDDGKVRRENTFALSADGKSLTETDVTPSPAPSTTSMTFHKM